MLRRSINTFLRMAALRPTHGDAIPVPPTMRPMQSSHATTRHQTPQAQNSTLRAWGDLFEIRNEIFEILLLFPLNIKIFAVDF